MEIKDLLKKELMILDLKSNSKEDAIKEIAQNFIIMDMLIQKKNLKMD